VPKRTIRDLELDGRRLFVRVDFNVPLREGVIDDDTRIRAALPTLRLALERGATLVVGSHLGRPKGIPNAKMSLAPVAKRLAELLQRPVGLAPDCIGPETASMARALCPGELLLLENLRFHAGEEANDPAFARELALLADVYVNDAFGAAHRAHASTAGVAELLEQHSAGLLMQRELEYLSMATSAPRHPYVAIIGGAKISGKIDVIRNLLTLADKVLIGGAMTYTFLKAKGFGTGASLLEDGRVELASDLLAEAGERLVLPVDHVIADGFSVDAAMQTVIGAVPDGWMGVDIGPETIATYESIIGDAALIVWNGPMGVFELEPFAKGTIAIARAVERASANSISIVGGGDSERAIRVAGVGRNITHISTGGGASLEFLGGQVLPGVAALG